jgi:hypothetical protein
VSTASSQTPGSGRKCPRRGQAVQPRRPRHQPEHQPGDGEGRDADDQRHAVVARQFIQGQRVGYPRTWPAGEACPHPVSQPVTAEVTSTIVSTIAVTRTPITGLPRRYLPMAQVLRCPATAASCGARNLEGLMPDAQFGKRARELTVRGA